MYIRKRILLVILSLILTVGFFNINVNAKSLSPDIPLIKAKVNKKGSAVKISIGKTKNAEGYEIRCSSYDDYYSVISCLDDSLPFTIKLEQNGTKKRSFVLRSLSSGIHKISVRAYRMENGQKIYSEFSKEKTVKVKKASAGFKDSYDFRNVVVGEEIKFGSYEQDNDFSNGKEPIEWIVVSKDNNSIQVISKYILDAVQYNYPWTEVTWEKSGLRKWLNNNFFDTAFNNTEKNMIKVNTVKAVNEYDENGGKNTKDKVYIASVEELDFITIFTYGYFAYDNTTDSDEWVARFSEGKSTPYMIANSRWQNLGYCTLHGGWATKDIGTSEWWGRGPQYGEAITCGYATETSSYTLNNFYNQSALWGSRGIRPIITIKLRS
jgi:hypothetical protein